MTGATLWILAKGTNRARAVSRAVPGVGIELRFLWNDDTRATQIYRTSGELAAAATAKREELLAAGWGLAATLADVAGVTNDRTTPGIAASDAEKT